MTETQDGWFDYSYDYECYNHDPYAEPYDDHGWWPDNSDEYHHHEAPYFSDNPESSDEYSFSNKLDQILDILKETVKEEENNSKRIGVIQEQIEKIAEQLNHQPSDILDNLSDTTQVNEVTFLCTDELYDNKVHKPTPFVVDTVVDDYVPLDANATQKICVSEDVLTESEKSQGALYEPVTPKVGEGFVEINTTTYPTTLEKSDTQLLDVPSGPTNDPPISNLETCFSCDRSKALDYRGSQNMKKILQFKKHDVTHSHKSKTKVFNKPRLKNSIPRKEPKLVKTTKFKHSRERIKSKMLVFQKINKGIPFDPGGSQITYHPP